VFGVVKVEFGISPDGKNRKKVPLRLGHWIGCCRA
jgi:hypothetical protein